MKRMFLMLIICVLCLGGCSTSDNAQATVAMWNEATERTMNRYTEVKDISTKNAEKLEALYLYGIYDETLESLFAPDKGEVINDEGMVTPNFLHSIQQGAVTDTYGLYLRSYLGNNEMTVDEFYPLIKEGSTDERVTDFLYFQAECTLHKFFTGLNTPTVTELYQYTGVEGVTLTITVVWQDNQIIYVDRATR